MGLQPANPTVEPIGVIETNTPVLVSLNHAVPAGGDITFTPPGGSHIPISNFESLVGTLFAQSQSSPQGASPYYRIRFAFSNSNDNFDALDVQDWVCATGPVSFTNNLRHDVTVNCLGDTVDISVHNYDSVAINVTIGLFGSYRGRSNEIRGRYPDDLSKESQGLSSDNIVMAYNPAAIPAGQTASQIMPLYAGGVTLTGVLTGEASAGLVPVRIQPQPSSVIAGQIICRTSAPGIFSQPSFNLPRRACLLIVDNSAGAAPVTPNLLVIGTSEAH